ncbi:methyltransferase domain-containing protein [Pseudonocardia sp. EV170527-09]|uniref:methyltransferase domain-containing protein n=1 Tax=Pseudonocardia sp. EV170527-09 TaxID=2603411 RepID=UPI0011F0CB12|nr:methyltransferase domain-containing protein [Pseudonocardia sp. EV170527-09]KAA1023362.1 methyltransferase domain-containing protein [Pseudonocardia sp. EV170527-09]
MSADRARSALVASLVSAGRVRTPAVRAALETVPRHLFLPALDPGEAYADVAVPIKVDDGVTVSSVSQPSMVAIMLEQLGAAPGHRVLEVGAGAGWNAALLAELVGPDGAVTTLDIDDDLVAGARANLDTAGFDGVDVVAGDGALGYPPGAPYDRIELTVGSTGVRPEWVAQLAPGGRLLLPLTVRGSQLSVAFVHTAPGRLRSSSVRSCAFVRLRGEGADQGAEVSLPDGRWRVQPACGSDDADDPDPRALARATTGEGTDRPVAAAGTVADLWDGLGLWAAIADPGVVRLFGPDEGGAAPALFDLGGVRVTLGLVAGDGCAVLLAAPEATVRACGPDGDLAAERLAGLIAGWVDAGRPHAADLRIEAVVPSLADPRDGTDSATSATSATGAPGAGPGEVLVDGAGTRLTLRWGPAHAGG